MFSDHFIVSSILILNIPVFICLCAAVKEMSHISQRLLDIKKYNSMDDLEEKVYKRLDRIYQYIRDTKEKELENDESESYDDEDSESEGSSSSYEDYATVGINYVSTPDSIDIIFKGDEEIISILKDKFIICPVKDFERNETDSCSDKNRHELSFKIKK